MSTTASGRLLDDQSPPQPVPGLVVGIRDESAIFASEFWNATSGADGRFVVTMDADATPEFGTRRLGVYVYTPCHRQLLFVPKDDEPAPDLALGDVTIPRAESTGFTVTLGGEKNPDGSPKARPVREGNAVRLLIDNESAWGHLKDVMEGAASEINVMQLEFDVPPEFHVAESAEQPEIVFSFGSPVDPVAGRKVDTLDYRPERILLDKASQGRKVRVIMPHQDLTNVTAGTAVIEILLALILLAIAPLGAYAISKYWPLLRGWKHLQDYLAAAGRTVDVQGFRVTPFNVVHAKSVLVDDTRAVVIGSPFNQSYWDASTHRVFDPRRGSATGEPVPVHDVSLGVRGPAFKDLHDAFRLHWNTSDPGASVAPIPVASPVGALEAGEDGVATLQLVRTLNAGAFPAIDKGERGILEAYLRAIEQAKKYIYLENQYFTNDAIGTALAAALNDTSRPALRIIVLINVTPDIPFYPSWQTNLIQRIRKEAGTNASRIEFFSAWSHDPPIPSLGHNFPMIMANYLHTKAAIVDDVWATLGSANLDGASLDACELIHALQFTDNVNHELNYVFFDGIDGHPAAGANPNVIDLLRRRLWGEHLGIDPGDAGLQASGSNSADWLQLWKTTANNKLESLRANPHTINPDLGRVLMYPQGPIGGLTDARSFLNSLFVGPEVVFDMVVERVRSFHFDQGSWA
ncbi:phospholipase D-like domain-containing protein [Paraburkholderia strydomiana]|uniref:Phospholipase D-like domain-containing protein n=1 Tax=Paraburkholderia strydomiana TaxID=1245417 RepID=A0ABW9BY99_9BURK